MKRILIALLLLGLGPLWGQRAEGEDALAQSRRTPIVAAIEKARPAVVSVAAQIRGRRGSFHDEFFDNFFGDMWRQPSRPSQSLGSGAVIDGAKGLIVTNAHVVEGAERVVVALSDGRELPAAIVGADARYDLAVLSVKSPKALPELKLGDSEQLLIGETVIAIGNPLGHAHSVTTGVVSAIGRTLPKPGGRGETYTDMIQTDASINPGNSGGPLLNINGEIIGINAAIDARGEGLGFAIPASQVRRIAARLARGGQNEAPLDLGLELAESGRPRRGETGCLVVEVSPGGPGQAGGLAKGDMLMKLDGSPTATVADYEMILSSLSPGRPVAAEVLRAGQPLALTLTPKAISEGEALDLLWRLYGLKVTEQRGFLILAAPADRSPAQALGLLQGDYLLAFGREVHSRAELAQASLEARFQTTVGIVVQRGRRVYQRTLSR
ncbi:MAG: trypsin-like peptidase domain-containing protein [Candidatus Adiutrix sp.]|nr:trypsin-like peptidase domain-containing protein [Candidatus Adiutrix sp.]